MIYRTDSLDQGKRFVKTGNYRMNKQGKADRAIICMAAVMLGCVLSSIALPKSSANAAVKPQEHRRTMEVARSVSNLMTVFGVKRQQPIGSQLSQSSPDAVILRMHGSNTIGAQLAPALAEAFLRKRGATDVKTLPVGPDEVRVQGMFLGDSSPKFIEIAAHGSATAFTDLIANKCDIGNASRAIKPDEAAHLSNLGDMTSPAAEHVLGLDGIAIIVNASNSIRSLSREQIRRLFDGDLTDWKQVGRADPGFINVYARDEKSGTWDTFKTLVLGNSPLIPTAKRIEDSRELSDLVANDPNGIGFIGLPYVHNSKAIAVSDEGTRPIFPTPLTVSTETYALSRRLYLYTATNPPNPVVREFVRFALSREGQEIVTRTGFVGQTTDPVVAPPPPSEAPSEYKQLITGAARLPLDFRFRSGKIDLDNKALEDMRRVVEFVSSPLYSGQRIILLGFADSTGSALANVKLSRDRAAIISAELESRGVKIFRISGFGSQLPVASNTTSEGRDKNRRVEIWLRP